MRAVQRRDGDSGRARERVLAIDPGAIDFPTAPDRDLRAPFLCLAYSISGRDRASPLVWSEPPSEFVAVSEPSASLLLSPQTDTAMVRCAPLCPPPAEASAAAPVLTRFLAPCLASPAAALHPLRGAGPHRARQLRRRHRQARCHPRHRHADQGACWRRRRCRRPRAPPPPPYLRPPPCNAGSRVSSEALIVAAAAAVSAEWGPCLAPCRCRGRVCPAARGPSPLAFRARR